MDTSSIMVSEPLTNSGEEQVQCMTRMAMHL